MTVYATVSLTIISPEKLAAYREQAASALAKYGGAVLHASKELEILEGSSTLPDMLAILTFPDKQSAVGWMNDPELLEIHELRRGSGTSTTVLL